MKKVLIIVSLLCFIYIVSNLNHKIDPNIGPEVISVIENGNLHTVTLKKRNGETLELTGVVSKGLKKGDIVRLSSFGGHVCIDSLSY